jgi:hypothetical protein
MTVPGVAVDGMVKLALVVKAPVSNETPATAPGVKLFVALSLVTECCIESVFETLMVVPGFTDIAAGEYWKFVMLMVFGAGVDDPQLQASATTASAARTLKELVSVRGSLSFVFRDTRLKQRCNRQGDTSSSARDLGVQPNSESGLLVPQRLRKRRSCVATGRRNAFRSHEERRA